MKASQSIDLQKIVIDYFEKYDDKTMVEVIESFVYKLPSKSNKTGELIEQFLNDNGLKEAFVNCAIDDAKEKVNPDYLFNRASASEREMIEQIKISFLNLAYNRLRHNTIDVKPEISVRVVEDKTIEPPKVKLIYDEFGDADVHILSDHDKYCLCGNRTEGEFITESVLNVTDKVTCPNCISLVKSIKKYRV